MENVKDIRQLTSELAEIYPVEDMYGSRASLYGRALKDSLITREEYNKAKLYYGGLWYYTGD